MGDRHPQAVQSFDHPPAKMAQTPAFGSTVQRFPSSKEVTPGPGAYDVALLPPRLGGGTPPAASCGGRPASGSARKGQPSESRDSTKQDQQQAEEDRRRSSGGGGLRTSDPGKGGTDIGRGWRSQRGAHTGERPPLLPAP